MRKKDFISKVLRLSFVMICLNISNTSYGIFVSERVGAEGIGLFHLVMSVYSLGSVISISGIGFTSTRLISDMPSPMASRCGDDVVRKCMRFCLVPACLASSVMFFGADFISENLLKNPSGAICLKMLAPSLIFNALSSVLGGYFTAFGRVGSISFSRLVSELVTWSISIILFSFKGTIHGYTAIIVAMLGGSFCEFAVSFFLWNRSRMRLFCENGCDYRAILALCAPIAIGSYLRCGLTSAENLLIPSMLKIHGDANPLALYGIIKGMTMPILMFPMVITGVFTGLIIPEIARRRSMGYKNGIRYISSLSLEYILKFGIIICWVFWNYHNEIADYFYSENKAGVYLGYLAFFAVFLFCDAVTDALLKGLDEQMSMLKINIADSVCRVICILVFVPRFGMVAYIAMMYVSETVNLGFSYRKLRRVSGLKFPFKHGILIPAVSLILSDLIMSVSGHLEMWREIALFVSLYIIFIMIFSRIEKLIRT